MALKLVSVLNATQHIQFQNSSGTNTGKIEASGDDLLITNSAGNVMFGDLDSDVYIGDGVNSVDMIFEQSGAIRGETGSSVTLTIGSSATTLNLYNPNMANGASLTSTLSIGAGGSIDFLPDTGAIIKLDGQTILKRNTFNGGITLGHDDAVIIAGGDTYNTLESNISLGNETVYLGAEGGVTIYAFPNNDTSWSNREKFTFANDGSLRFGTAEDTNLYRSAANTLKTDDDFIVGGGDLYITDSDTRLNAPNSSMLRVNTPSGYIEIAPANTSHAHIQTDRGNFYFNKEIRVDSGVIGSYDEDLYLRRASDSANQMQITTNGVLISKALYIPQYIYHNGDTNTYIQFDADRIRLTAGGTTKFDSNNTYLTSINNGNWSGTDLAIANGGTGASTASAARTNLGLGSLATLSAVGASQITDNSVGAAELNVSGNGTSGQVLASDGDGSFSWTSAGGTGTVTQVTVGSGLDVSNQTTTPYITLDLSELTDMTAAVNTSQDELILLDNGAERRKLFSEIFGSNAYNSTTIPTNNNQLTNGAGYTTATGTVQTVTGTGTKNGLTLTDDGDSVDPTLTLGGTLAINNADWSGTDLSIANGGTGASTASAARTNLGLGTAATSASTDFVSASGNDSITHATGVTGLHIYTSGGGQPTTQQLKVGRSTSQYWGVRTDDTTAYLVHRQDETDSTAHGTRFEIWSSSSGEATWKWAKANNSGGSQAEKMKLTDSSVLTLGGGTNTITNTKVGQWDTAYGWGDHSSAGYSTATGVANNANNYSLPAGSSSVRGGFKIGYSENGKNYPVEVSSEKMFVNVPWTDTNTNTQLSNEQVQDIVGAMVSSNTETNISVTYDDTNGKLNFASTDTNTQLSDAQVRSKISGTGLIGYNSSTGVISTTANNYVHPTGAGNKHIPSGGASGQFLKYSSSGTAVWATPSYTTNTDTQLTNEQVQDIVGAMVSSNTETNISVTYDDTNGKLNFASTDTNTQLSTAQVRSKISGTGLISYNSSTGAISTSADNYNDWKFVDNADSSTNIRSANYVKFQGASISGSGTQGSPYLIVTPDTNTTYTAGGDYGLTLNGTQFRLEDDRRRNSSSTDIYTGNTHDYTFYDADVGIRWYTAAAEEMRLENDGDLHVDGDVIAFSTTVSDERLKDNVETIENATEKVKQLRGVSYTWNDGSREGQREIGVIAQEVEEVIPEVVHEKTLPFVGNDETYKTVDYEKLVALLIESNKELASRVETLEAKLDGFTK